MKKNTTSGYIHKMLQFFILQLKKLNINSKHLWLYLLRS